MMAGWRRKSSRWNVGWRRVSTQLKKQTKYYTLQQLLVDCIKMDLGLPQECDFTPEELRIKLFVHPDDRVLPPFFRLPLGGIIVAMKMLPRKVPKDHTIPSNWNNHYEGFQVWGLPAVMEDHPSWDNGATRSARINRSMLGQDWYKFAGYKYPVSP